MSAFVREKRPAIPDPNNIGVLYGVGFGVQFYIGCSFIILS